MTAIFSPSVPASYCCCTCVQFGLLYLAYPNGAGGGPQRVRPSAHLTVRWELPAGCIDGIGRPRRELGGGAEPQRLMVGLFRLGVGSNTAGIISKKMFERPPRGVREPREMLIGTVPFYAPKSVSFLFLRTTGKRLGWGWVMRSDISFSFFIFSFFRLFIVHFYLFILLRTPSIFYFLFFILYPKQMRFFPRRGLAGRVLAGPVCSFVCLEYWTPDRRDVDNILN